MLDILQRGRNEGWGGVGGGERERDGLKTRGAVASFVGADAVKSERLCAPADGVGGHIFFGGDKIVGALRRETLQREIPTLDLAWRIFKVL